MLHSIIIYGGLLCVLSNLAFYANHLNKQISLNTKYSRLFVLLLILLIFSLILGSRYDVGIDHLSYLSMYLDLSKGYDIQTTTIEPGWVLLNKLFINCGAHYSVFFSFLCALQILFILLAFKDRINILPWVLFALMCGPFLSWLSLIRQYQVICIFIWLSMTIEKRNFINYLFWIIICAFFFHKSALILLLIYPFIKCRKSFTGPIVLQIIIFTICLYIGITKFLLNKLEFMNTIAFIVGYGDSYGQVDDFERFNRDTNFGIRSYLVTLLIYITIFLSNKLKYGIKDNTIKTFYNYYFYGYCLFMITFGLDAVGRFFHYFYGTAFVIYGYLLYYLYKNKRKSKLDLFKYISVITLNLLTFIGLLYDVQIDESHTMFRFYWQL